MLKDILGSFVRKDPPLAEVKIAQEKLEGGTHT